MKAYFFKYPDIGKVIQSSFPVTRLFRKKEYPLEEEFESSFGSGQELEVLYESIAFSLEALKLLMDIDLQSSGFDDFDSVAKHIRKQNDYRFEVIFLTNRTRDLYEKRLSDMISAMDNPQFKWFVPSKDFKSFSKFVARHLSQVDSEIACVLIMNT
jgi:hypothetical protein